MYFFHFAIFVNCYYFHLFVPSVRSFDIFKKKTNQNGVGTAICRLSDEKIQKLNTLTEEQLNLYATAQWHYNTNKTKDTTKEALKSSVRLFLYQNLLIEAAKNMSLVFGINYEDMLTSVYFIRDYSVCQLDLNEFKTTIILKSKLKTLMNELTVCEYQTTDQPCDITADEIKFIMLNSSDASELKYYWKAWHNHTSFEARVIYLKYIGVMNHIAKLNSNENNKIDVSNQVDYHMKPYVDDGCHLNVERMYETIRPLYLQLFTHVRKVLRNKFGSVAISANGPIPVHLLGSILGQPWTNLLPLMTHEHIIAYENHNSNTKSAKQLFDQANGFFASIGMGSVPNSVWSESVFEENKNFADCTPSSWDMYKKNDFRIKMCFRDTVEDVYTMYKQLGLVHYFLSYKKQSITFQNLPDEVFADGMLNALTLSVQYQHFIDRFNDSTHSRHGYLLRMALEKVAVLPFARAAHAWHSTSFKGSIAPKRMNDLWWSKRAKYEGVVSPIAKNKDKCMNSNYRPFDPSASYNAMVELPSIRYFLGPIIEFQIFKALCTICGEYNSKSSQIKPLYECNLRGFKRIGKIIKSTMSKGSSMKWQILFETIVGHRRLEIEPLLEYFKPLHDNLYVTNNETNEYIGWK